MGINTSRAGYFYTVDDLSLTPEQEAKLNEYVPMVRSMCRRFIERTRNHQGDDPRVSADDLVQMALVRLTIAIKHNKAEGVEHESRYYCRLVTRSCLAQAQFNKIRGNRDNHVSVDDPDSELYLSSKDDIDRIHDKIYINNLLDGVKSNYNKQILMHYYGIETAPLYPRYISDVVPLTPVAIEMRRFRSIRSLRNKINNGDLSSCQTE